jgi:hypothetical protein
MRLFRSFVVGRAMTEAIAGRYGQRNGGENDLNTCDDL